MLTSPCIIFETAIMGLRHVSALFLIFILGASQASAQPWKPWQIITPRQVLPVPSDGTTVNFPNVNLISGMKYRVHATGVVKVSAQNEQADASWYISVFGIGVAPTFIPVSLKVKYDGTNEDWFYNFWRVSGFQPIISFAPNHIYDASIPSTGFPLAFRFNDSQYGDNSGNILIDVARETPGIAIEKDTLDFGNVTVSTPKMLLDSIESYGVDGYKVDNVSMIGAAASKFLVKSERTVSFVITDTTNEFQFTYTPTGNMRDSAEFHIFSSNGFGADKEKIIYLYGNGISSQLAFIPDTLDFGGIRKGRTKTLQEVIVNLNNAPATITSITPESGTPNFIIVGTPLLLPAGGRGPVSVTFAPQVDGPYFEKFDVVTDDGTLFHFYARGVAGEPIPQLEKDVLDFGQIIIGQSRTLNDDFVNYYKAATDLNVVSTLNTNPAEYSISPVKAQGAFTFTPGQGVTYNITFSPQVHIPFCANHDGKFVLTFDDGTSSTITFKGCDHQPLTVKLAIDTNYYVNAGSEVNATQKLINVTDPLDSTLTPVTSLVDSIVYDASLLDLVSVNKGALINSNQWNLNVNTSPGGIGIAISTTTSHFGPSGSLVTLRFRAHADAKVGQFTNLVQRNISFSNSLEPFATTTPGRITISDMCTPVRISTGNITTSIEQNNPNPFNPTTHIQYAVAPNSEGSAVNVRITLYDMLGRLAGVLVDEAKTPGIYNYQFDGSPYSSGAYMYVFQAGDIVDRKTMILAK